MKYYKFLLESLYKNLIIISKKKKKTNKFRIKMQNLSITKKIAMANLSIICWKKKNKNKIHT